MKSYLKALALLLVVTTVSACGGNDGDQDGAPVIFSGDGNTDDSGYDYGDANFNGETIRDGAIVFSDITGLTEGTQSELEQVVGDRVFFNFNSSSLNESSQRTLQRQAQWLKQNPAVNIVVEGHCDERGTREYNLALGESRAESVRRFLVGQGVGSGRVRTISYGKEHPEFLGSNEVSWSKNRRGVTVIE